MGSLIGLLGLFALLIWLRFVGIIADTDLIAYANIAVVATALFIALQLIEVRKTALAQAYDVVRGFLQDENAREARGAVFEVQKKGKDINEWVRKNDKNRKHAELVCHTYDSAGQMVRNRLIKKQMIIANWGPSLRRIWPILEPYVIEKRDDYCADEYWDDFEWLASEALKTDKFWKRVGAFFARNFPWI